MKTTVKLKPELSVIVQPAAKKPGCVHLCMYLDSGISLADDKAWGVTMTQDQAGALLFGIERAAEAARIAQEQAGGKCNARGDQECLSYGACSDAGGCVR